MQVFLMNLDLAEKGAWFPLVFGSLALLIMLFIPKRMTAGEIYATFGVVAFVTLAIDIYLMASWLDVFDLGSPDINGLADLVTYSVVPSSLAVIFLNCFKSEKKWVYVVLFTLISFLFEFILVQVGYMNLKGWQSWYSIPVYLAVYGLWLPWHLRLIRKTR